MMKAKDAARERRKKSVNGLNKSRSGGRKRKVLSRNHDDLFFSHSRAPSSEFPLFKSHTHFIFCLVSFSSAVCCLLRCERIQNISGSALSAACSTIIMNNEKELGKAEFRVCDERTSWGRLLGDDKVVEEIIRKSETFKVPAGSCVIRDD
jgi:hypothetical protein